MNSINYYQSFKDFTPDELTDYLESACQHNDIDGVKYLIGNSELSCKLSLNGHRLLYTNDNNAISIACELGHLEILDVLLSLPNIESKVENFQYELDRGLLLAAKGGNIDVLRYLTTSPKLNKHADVKYSNGKALGLACSNGHLEVVKYVLTSPELKEHISIHVRKGFYLLEACWNNHFEVVKYLLTSPELKTHPDIHNNNDEIFSYALSENQLDLIKFLIFDININENENIKELVEEQDATQVKAWFKLRELNKDLKENLPGSDISSKKIKL